MAPLHLSRSFQSFFHNSAPFVTRVFTILTKNGKKPVAKTGMNGKGKKAFLYYFCSIFFFYFSFLGTCLLRRLLMNEQIHKVGHQVEQVRHQQSPIQIILKISRVRVQARG